jgi:CubicO group peptidase (beta-lactamase class C family)
MKKAILLLFILGSLCAQAQVSINVMAALMPETKTHRIDSLLNVLADARLFNGSVLIAENGHVVYEKSIGYIDKSRQIPNTDTTRFNLASLSKPFTAVAILQLVQKGKLKLDDPFIKYFPDFPYPAIRIRHLLTHTSGLPSVEKEEAAYVSAHPNEIVTNENAYAHLVAAKSPLVFQPGDNEAYNNMNYLLLGMLVEKISRVPFAVYMEKNVFKPAGMPKTYVRTANMPNTTRYIMPDFYTSSYRNVDSLDHSLYYTNYNLGGWYGPNNVISTLQDLLNFDKTLMSGKLIKPALLEAAFAPVTLNNGKVFHMGNSTRSYGFGWNVYTSKTAPTDTFIFHDGHIVGISTILHHNISKNQTIIFYDNTGNPPLQLMLSLSNILNNQSPQKIRVTQSLARLYGETLIGKGPDAAIAKLITLKSDTAHYYLDELEMNTLGFDLLKAPLQNHNELSLEVFKINTLLYPKSGNTYDSYGEALEKNGKKDEAVLMYKISLALSPDNEAGKQALQRLSGQKQ